MLRLLSLSSSTQPSMIHPSAVGLSKSSTGHWLGLRWGVFTCRVNGNTVIGYHMASDTL